MRAMLLGLAGAALAFLPAGVLAQASGSHMDSQYTDIDFDQCTTIETDELGATSVCPGYKGYPVVVSDEDERMTVSYGVRPLEERAAGQGFGPFNHIGQKIEWRIESDDDTFQPRATIVRWYLAGEDGSDKNQILVVTQLKLGATCQIALIDALAVKDANSRAREIADQNGGNYDCSKEPEIIQPFRAY